MRAPGSEAGSYAELRVVPGSPLPEPFWRRWMGSRRSRVGPPRPMPDLCLRLFPPGVLVLEVGSPAPRGLPEITEREVDDGQYRAIGRLFERGARLCSPIEPLPATRFARVVLGGGAPADPLRGIPLGDGGDGSAAPAPALPILAAFHDLVARLRAEPSSHPLVWTPPAVADLEMPRHPQSPVRSKDLFGDGSDVPEELPIVRFCGYATHDSGGRKWLNLYGDGRALLTSEPTADSPARVLARTELGSEEVRRLAGLAGMAGIAGTMPVEARDGEYGGMVDLLEGDRYCTGYIVYDDVMGEPGLRGGGMRREATKRFLEAFERLVFRLQFAGESQASRSGT